LAFTIVVQFFDFPKNYQLWVFQKLESKNWPVLGISKNQNKELADSRYFKTLKKTPESKNWPVLGISKNQNKEVADSRCFKTLKEIAVSMREWMILSWFFLSSLSFNCFVGSIWWQEFQKMGSVVSTPKFYTVLIIGKLI
jgi:hypothetical protein